MNDLLLLAMLLDGPKYGYQLKREVGWMMGQGKLHNNIVYPLLRRFLEEGWVSKKAVPGERGQTRQQYALTAEGRRRYFERTKQFSEDDASSQEAFFLRVGVFEALPADSRIAILSAREAFLQGRDQKLETLQENMDLGKFGDEIVRHMRKQIQMDLEWIRHLRRIAKTEMGSKTSSEPLRSKLVQSSN
jgi:DNA-binding PadR family transcriptional regulator